VHDKLSKLSKVDMNTVNIKPVTPAGLERWLCTPNMTDIASFQAACRRVASENIAIASAI
jgi:hypothetical protein